MSCGGEKPRAVVLDPDQLLGVIQAEDIKHRALYYDDGPPKILSSFTVPEPGLHTVATRNVTVYAVEVTG